MSTANLWLALSQQALDEFRYKRQNCSPEEVEGETVCVDPYSGPMDDETFSILKRMADTDNVQRMFKTVDAGGKTYTMFSLYLPGSTQAKDAVEYITEKWPGHIIAVGAWMWDGRPAGMQWEVDAEGVAVLTTVVRSKKAYATVDGVDYWRETTGDALYPLHAQAWKFMPDVDGVPPSSIADMQDINLLQGQTERYFR